MWDLPLARVPVVRHGTSGDHRIEVSDSGGTAVSSRSFGLSFESVEGGPRHTARFRCELPASPRVDRDIVWARLENDLPGLTRDIAVLAR